MPKLYLLIESNKSTRALETAGAKVTQVTYIEFDGSTDIATANGILATIDDDYWISKSTIVTASGQTTEEIVVPVHVANG